MPNKLLMPDVKRMVLAMLQTLFGVNMSIFKGAMAPGSEVTFFWACTSVSTLSGNNPIKEIFNFCDCFVRLFNRKILRYIPINSENTLI